MSHAINLVMALGWWNPVDSSTFSTPPSLSLGPILLRCRPKEKRRVEP
jgi:hypothetical protein